nr:hypothetical protein [Lachnospiraceae bacterium]
DILVAAFSKEYPQYIKKNRQTQYNLSFNRSGECISDLSKKADITKPFDDAKIHSNAKIKYEITDKTKKYKGRTLHQIRRMSDGKLGGWIESTDNLSQDGNCWIEDDAKVYDNAKVSDNAKVFGNAEISGNAKIFGSTYVCGDTEISDNVTVYDNAAIFNNAKISGNVKVHDSAVIYDNAQIYGNATIYGDAEIFGSAEINRGNIYYDVTTDLDQYKIGICENQHAKVDWDIDFESIFEACEENAEKIYVNILKIKDYKSLSKDERYSIINDIYRHNAPSMEEIEKVIGIPECPLIPPSTVNYAIASGDDEYITEYLTQEYGWCINGYTLSPELEIAIKEHSPYTNDLD